MNKIVIIHHPSDQNFAIDLAVSLDEAGADVFLEVQASPQKWKTDLPKGLKTADVMVLILSPESMEDDVLTGYWETFLRKNKPLVPIYWRECEPHYKLSRLQYVDFRDGVVKYDKGVNVLLLEMIQGHRLDLRKPRDSTIPDKRLIADIILAQSGHYPSMDWELERKSKFMSRVWIGLGVLILLVSMVISYLILFYEPNVVPIETTPNAPRFTSPIAPVPLEVSFYYTESVFGISNLGDAPLDISAWRFVAGDLNYSAEELWSGLNRVSGVDVIFGLPRGSCLEAYRDSTVDDAAPHNAVCLKLQGGVAVDESFWGASFDILAGEIWLGTCRFEESPCEISIK